MRRWSPELGLALALGLGLAGCNAQKTAFQLGIPGSRIDLAVADVKQRMDYLDTRLQGSGWELRTFLPASPTCRHVVDGESVQYLADGPYGTLVRGDERCVAAGLGSLREWRDRRPRDVTARSIVPSAQASYREVYRDADVAFLRGQFPLAYKLGFAGLGDVIAVVPLVPVCEPPLQRDTSTLEYFEAGSNVLTLSSRDGRCNLAGLIRPLSPAELER